MAAIFKLIGIVLLIAIAAVLVFFGMIYIVIAFAVMMGIFIAGWAVGIPITITHKGKKIGYYRWLTFYPVGRQQ